MRLIGDIHGDVYAYRCIADRPSIQIGDFGIGFGQSDYWHRSVNDFQREGQHRFIRGNHDNPKACKSMSGYIPDGTVEGDVMFIGGAWSIDNPVAPPGWYRRTPDVDWWFDEECSDDQFEHMYNLYVQVKPRVLITHDCPASIAYQMFWKTGFVQGLQYPTRTGTWLDRFYTAHQPQFHFFGHWHKTMRYTHKNTVFQCIGERDYIDIEL